MCELFCLSSRVPTIATFSLETFARHGGCEGNEVDGWGIAFYEGNDARLYKEPEPAGNSAWLGFIERRRVPSQLVISHIRHATRGGLSHANTQPFQRELGGRLHVFAHNGQLDGVSDEATAPRRFRPLGETDSEIAFCLLLERLAPLWEDRKIPAIGERLRLVAQFAAAMRKLGPANFLYADGDAVFAHGDRRLQASGTFTSPGLWRLQRTCAVDADIVETAGVTIAPGGQEVMLIASVPLSAEPWQSFIAGEVIAVKDGTTMVSASSIGWRT